MGVGAKGRAPGPAGPKHAQGYTGSKKWQRKGEKRIFRKALAQTGGTPAPVCVNAVASASCQTGP